MWDGLVRILPASFGPSSRKWFKDSYLRSKEAGEIIGSLDAGPEPLASLRPAAAVASRELDTIVACAAKLKPGGTSKQASAFRLLKVAAEAAAAASADQPDMSALMNQANRAQRALNRLVDAIERDLDQ